MSGQTEFAIPPQDIRLRPLPAPVDIEASPLPSKVMQPSGPVPCRKCLKFTTVGDEVVLFSYDPFLGDSPYRCASPVFMHLKPECDLAADSGIFLEQHKTRQLSVRGYTKDHCLAASEVVEGAELVALCNRMFADTNVEYIHVHFASQGCFAVKVERR